MPKQLPAVLTACVIAAVVAAGCSREEPIDPSVQGSSSAGSGKGHSPEAKAGTKTPAAPGVVATTGSGPGGNHE